MWNHNHSLSSNNNQGLNSTTMICSWVQILVRQSVIWACCFFLSSQAHPPPLSLPCCQILVVLNCGGFSLLNDKVALMFMYHLYMKYWVINLHERVNLSLFNGIDTNWQKQKGISYWSELSTEPSWYVLSSCSIILGCGPSFPVSHVLLCQIGSSWSPVFFSGVRSA